ncbi:tRNA pseudouridine(38-40) synthase TruA [Arachidicoccus soli]|uniref:tRNA pseudouridine synthase A n=1 Tax=Arachidicoccus soli TaxID=2341117 RepID=A0A386HKS2_9BACT|nr:tRNA pseudouridine(38-40) synthase TruA [Arachidicoccus soli]AYD46355.1 tRNA pseudouridine(38-40) synthase TruA [Arachidicoccus soli]
MPRYFLELSYKGTAYKGFQFQPNVPTIQGEVENAFLTILKQQIKFTTSSRTDAGVHARQNFFHFDMETHLSSGILYNLNALLPPDISLKNLFEVSSEQHSRFHATSRVYRYYIYRNKNPFLVDRAWYYPFNLDKDKLQQAADLLLRHTDFTSFSKRNTQTHSFICDIQNSCWYTEGDCLIYQVEANRFLRGMVRALVGTMLKVGRSLISLTDFEEIIKRKDCSFADFSTPSQGLFLEAVRFPFL